MQFLANIPLGLFADASAASNAMRSYVTPVVATLCALASLACVFFLVNGGIRYMTSTGNPEKLEHAKKVIKNALIGLVLVIGAATLTAILSHAYGSGGGMMAEKFPALTPVENPGGGSLTDVLLNAIVGLFRHLIQSAGEPFVKGLAYFTTSTPLMGDNSSVFNLWLGIVGITDVIFVVVVALLGFHVMSFASFGFEELEIKHLLPQLTLIFLLINTSIFAIDGIISFSNAMIKALYSGFPVASIWDTLAEITKKGSDLGLAGLLVMIAFLVLTVMLLVYYVGRLITLYIGAVLSPLILLLWLLPAFKDFAITAAKIYLTAIFVLFVHVVILLLAGSIFTGMLHGDNAGQPNTLMALIVGMAALIALLKTQGVMRELSYAASGPRAAREVTSSFMRGVSYMNKTRKMAVKGFKTGRNVTKKVAHMGSSRGSRGNSSGSKRKLSGDKTDRNPPGSTKVKPRQIEPKPLKTDEPRRAESTELKK